MGIVEGWGQVRAAQARGRDEGADTVALQAGDDAGDAAAMIWRAGQVCA